MVQRFRTLARVVAISMVLSIGLTGCMSKGPRGAGDGAIASPPREFRAAWVATVANIDWPTKPGLSVEEQKKEAIVILDKLVELNFNAVVFQVRPHADAMYKSDLEPWSYYLTGQQGKAPDPFYDPLKFWIDESHARGLQLHAWFNPYRANHPANKGELAANSLVKAHPEMVVKLGDKGYYWMDPALKSVQDQSTDVCMDVVRRYDVDGIHFDDYFYPYDEYNDGKDFPDDESYQAYQAAGGKMERNDWRRAAVNTFIEGLGKKIKEEKPWVQYGISPFGIWRPGNPPSIAGYDQYDKLFADAKLWFNEGWVDYMTPQLYWPVSRVAQSYPVLLGWWKEENTMKRHLWPGLSISAAGREGGPLETINQIMVTRGMVPESPGNILFSMKTLVNNTGELGTKLVESVDSAGKPVVGPYKTTALVPPSPWLDDEAPDAPWVDVQTANGQLTVKWEAAPGETPFQWVVYTERSGRWSYEILPVGTTTLKKELGEKPVTRVAVSVVDRLGNESAKTVASVSADLKM